MEFDVNAVFLDLDGTLYRGNSPIEDAGQFVQILRKRQIPFLFITNNSTLTPSEVADKLCRLGVKAHTSEVLTSSQGVAAFLSHHPNATIYAIGERGLKQALVEHGFQLVDEHDAGLSVDQVDFVVVGLDRSFTYDKLKRAALYIQHGAKLIGTNPDLRLPTEEGLIPGSGVICRAVGLAAPAEPVFIGKPEPHLFEQAARLLNVQGAGIWAIGDNIETDIAAAQQLGYSSALVLTGYTNEGDIASSANRPTLVAKNLTTLARLLKL